MANEYKEVPVQAAHEIAQRCDKNIVIIVCWDEVHQRSHITTYGREPEQKMAAAAAGERIARELGLSMDQATHYEDFRTRSAAEAAKILEENQFLRARNDELWAIVDANLHERRCHDCTHVFWAKDAKRPYCLCPRCKSQDTRKVAPPSPPAPLPQAGEGSV